MPTWTYCRDCIFWRVRNADAELVPATADDDLGPSGCGPGCYRHAADMDAGAPGVGAVPDNLCGGGFGCGEGVPRKKGKRI